MRARFLSLLFLAIASNPISCGLGDIDPPPVVDLERTEGIDADVIALVRKSVATARLRPSDAKLRVDLALVYEANELWREAIRAWNGALVLDPTQSMWRYHLSTCLRRQGDPVASIAELRRVVAEAPDLAAARFALGELLLDNDDLEGAQVEFEASIALAAHIPDTHVGLAEVMIRKHEYTRAVELCQRAIAIEPAGKRARYALGLSYRGLGRMQEAEVELTRGQNSVKRGLGDPLTDRMEDMRVGYSQRFNRAMTLDSMGNTPAAALIFESLLRSYPDSVEVLNNLAAAYTEMKRNDSAYALLLRARDLQPDEFATYINLAAADIAMKNLGLALEHANKAVELAPNLAQARFTRAGVHMEAQRFEEAYTDLKLATSLDASSGEILGRLGEVSVRTGRLREAVGYFESAAQRMPDSLPAQASLARIYFRVGEQQKALAAFARALKLAPNHPEIRALGAEIGAPLR
jgi:tetratricopeptide (TPR) repeat protein